MPSPPLFSCREAGSGSPSGGSTGARRTAGTTPFFFAASGGHIEAARRAPPHSQRITHKDNAMPAHHFGVS